MTDIQSEIPQEGYEGAQVFVPAVFNAISGKDEQVNVGVGVKLTAPVAANGYQGNVR
jgi:hypothetical protein